MFSNIIIIRIAKISSGNRIKDNLITIISNTNKMDLLIINKIDQIIINLITITITTNPITIIILTNQITIINNKDFNKIKTNI